MSILTFTPFDARDELLKGVFVWAFRCCSSNPGPAHVITKEIGASHLRWWL